MKIHGSCLCGDFRFELVGPVRFLKNCHCSRCRKQSGSSYFTYARAETRHLRIVAGASCITRYERAPGSVIAFCRRCGSPVPHPPEGSAEVEIAAGLLDDDPGVGVAYHVHVASRAPWCSLDDQLPKFEAMNPVPLFRLPHAEAESECGVTPRRPRVP
jgi:hypothetical protein